MPVHYSEIFADFYERFWTGWIRELAPTLPGYFDSIPTPARSALDLCCGTGTAIEAFAAAGWSAFGVDRSAPMLAIARRKLMPVIEAGRLQLLHADATEFELPERVGACVCLDGSLNHLDSAAELAKVFHAVSNALLDGGQLVFDLLQPIHFAHWHNLSIIDTSEAVVIKTGVWDTANCCGLQRISGALAGDTGWLRFEQVMGSRTFSDDEVEAALAAAGLRRLPCELESAGYPQPFYTGKSGSTAVLSGGPNRVFYRAVKAG